MPHEQPHAFASRSRRDLLRLVVGFFFLVGLGAAVAAAKKNPPSHPVDLNVATVKELEELPGVGPTTAKAIVEFRNKSGRFRRVNDLLVIRGISEAKLAKMRPYLTVAQSPAATPPKKATSGPTKP